LAELRRGGGAEGVVAAIAKLNGYKGSFRNWDDEDKLDKLFADEKVFK
jgi:hypothetical protein